MATTNGSQVPPAAQLRPRPPPSHPPSHPQSGAKVKSSMVALTQDEESHPQSYQSILVDTDEHHHDDDYFLDIYQYSHDGISQSQRSRPPPNLHKFRYHQIDQNEESEADKCRKEFLSCHNPIDEFPQYAIDDEDAELLYGFSPSSRAERGRPPLAATSDGPLPDWHPGSVADCGSISISSLIVVLLVAGLVIPWLLFLRQSLLVVVLFGGIFAAIALLFAFFYYVHTLLAEERAAGTTTATTGTTITTALSPPSRQLLLDNNNTCGPLNIPTIKIESTTSSSGADPAEEIHTRPSLTTAATHFELVHVIRDPNEQSNNNNNVLDGSDPLLRCNL